MIKLAWNKLIKIQPQKRCIKNNFLIEHFEDHADEYLDYTCVVDLAGRGKPNKPNIR